MSTTSRREPLLVTIRHLAAPPAVPPRQLAVASLCCVPHVLCHISSPTTPPPHSPGPTSAESLRAARGQEKSVGRRGRHVARADEARDAPRPETVDVDRHCDEADQGRPRTGQDFARGDPGGRPEFAAARHAAHGPRDHPDQGGVPAAARLHGGRLDARQARDHAPHPRRHPAPRGAAKVRRTTDSRSRAVLAVVSSPRLRVAPRLATPTGAPAGAWSSSRRSKPISTPGRRRSRSWRRRPTR